MIFHSRHLDKSNESPAVIAEQGTPVMKTLNKKTRFYPHRTFGRHCHHRHSDGPAVACSSKRT